MQNVVAREFAFRAEGEALLGSRVSWQGAWAGTITTLAAATILWALALAIIPLAMHPTVGSLRGATIAAWICLMATIIVANFLGGLVASRVRGSPRMSVGMFHGFITWALTFVIAMLFSALFMRGLLVGLVNALPDVMAASPTAPVDPDLAAEGRSALHYLIGFGWSWFGTWFLSLLFALVGAAVGVRRMRRRLEPEVQVESGSDLPPITPLTPAPSA
jgi:hypothetical protein